MLFRSQDSGVLDSLNTKKVRKDARDYEVDIQLDRQGKIIFPNDRKSLKDLLLWLNEGFFEGVITGDHYRTNSKKKA